MEHQFSAYLIASTLVASRMPVYVSHTDCTCGWAFESRDVTERGSAMELHWRQRNS